MKNFDTSKLALVAISDISVKLFGYKTKNPKLLASGSAPKQNGGRGQVWKWKMVSTVLEDGGLPEYSKYMAVIWIRKLIYFNELAFSVTNIKVKNC